MDGSVARRFLLGLAPWVGAVALGLWSLNATLAGIAFTDPTTTLLANADAREITTGEEARAELVDHLTAGVDWVAAVERMTAAGVTTFVEVGPGQVLTGLLRRCDRSLRTMSVSDPESLEKLQETLSAA